MTAEEFTRLVKGFGLSFAGVARLFHTNERSPRRWADPTSDQSVPRAVAISLRLMEKHGERPESVEAMMNEKDKQQ